MPKIGTRTAKPWIAAPEALEPAQIERWGVPAVPRDAIDAAVGAVEAERGKHGGDAALARRLVEGRLPPAEQAAMTLLGDLCRDRDLELNALVLNGTVLPLREPVWLERKHRWEVVQRVLAPTALQAPPAVLIGHFVLTAKAESALRAWLEDLDYLHRAWCRVRGRKPVTEVTDEHRDTLYEPMPVWEWTSPTIKPAQ